MSIRNMFQRFRERTMHVILPADPTLYRKAHTPDPDAAAAAEGLRPLDEATVIRWTQRTGYLFVECDEQGGLVHTNVPGVFCPRCKHMVTDESIDRTEFANHRCGNKCRQ